MLLIYLILFYFNLFFIVLFNNVNTASLPAKKSRGSSEIVEYFLARQASFLARLTSLPPASLPPLPVMGLPEVVKDDLGTQQIHQGCQTDESHIAEKLFAVAAAVAPSLAQAEGIIT